MLDLRGELTSWEAVRLPNGVNTEEPRLWLEPGASPKSGSVTDQEAGREGALKHPSHNWPQLRYCSFLNMFWKMSGPQTDPRA
jgi:hypothetical protein